MFTTWVVIGLGMVFEAILIGRMIVRDNRRLKYQYARTKDWRNGWN